MHHILHIEENTELPKRVASWNPQHTADCCCTLDCQHATLIEPESTLQYLRANVPNKVVLQHHDRKPAPLLCWEV